MLAYPVTANPIAKGQANGAAGSGTHATPTATVSNVYSAIAM